MYSCMQLRMSYIFEIISAFCPKVHMHVCVYGTVQKCTLPIWHDCVCVCVGVWLPGWEGCGTWKRLALVFAIPSLFVHLKAIIFKEKQFNLYTIVYVNTYID